MLSLTILVSEIPTTEQVLVDTVHNVHVCAVASVCTRCTHDNYDKVLHWSVYSIIMTDCWYCHTYWSLLLTMFQDIKIVTKDYYE